MLGHVHIQKHFVDKHETFEGSCTSSHTMVEANLIGVVQVADVIHYRLD